MRLVKTIIYLLLMFAFSSCIYNKLNIPKDQISNFNAQVKKWKEDKGGCSNVRDGEMANELLGVIKNSKLSHTQVKYLLGEPDREKKTDTQTICTYAFAGYCENGKLKKDADHCYLQIIYANDNLNEPYISTVGCY